MSNIVEPKRATLFQFDIETLSLDNTNAVVAEIGCAVHKVEKGHDLKVTYHDSISILFDMQEQIDSGRHIGANVVQWWMKQNEDARLAMASSLNRVSVSAGISRLREWMLQKMLDDTNVYFMASAVQFDFGNIESLFKEAGILVPWPHNRIHSQRTLRMINEKNLNKEFEGEHTARLDAIKQNEVLLTILGADGYKDEENVSYAATQALRTFFKL